MPIPVISCCGPTVGLHADVGLRCRDVVLLGYLSIIKHRRQRMLAEQLHLLTAARGGILSSSTGLYLSNFIRGGSKFWLLKSTTASRKFFYIVHFTLTVHTVSVHCALQYTVYTII